MDLLPSMVRILNVVVSRRLLDLDSLYDSTESSYLRQEMRSRSLAASRQLQPRGPMLTSLQISFSIMPGGDERICHRVMSEFANVDYFSMSFQMEKVMQAQRMPRIYVITVMEISVEPVLVMEANSTNISVIERIPARSSDAGRLWVPTRLLSLALPCAWAVLSACKLARAAEL